MTTTAPVRLEPLCLIPAEAVPKSCRREIATREECRKQALGDAVSLMSLSATSGVFAGIYLSGAVFMLMRGMYVLGALAMFIYFGLGLVACYAGDRSYRTIRERRRLAIDEPLRLKAAAEQALADAALHLNIETAAWNQCVRLASEANFDAMDNILIVMRSRISAKIRGFEQRLDRFLSTIATAQGTGPLPRLEA